MLTGATLGDIGIEAAAIKPTEVAVERAPDLGVDCVVVDYEGGDHLPSPGALRTLADEVTVRLTTPVRADGFDPLGDDSRAAALPAEVRRVLVAGHPAYLSDREAARAITPRIRAAAGESEDPWIGTEGIERPAMALGGTQFELLSRTTESELRAVRDAGFDGEIAVYAPTVLTDSEDTALDALGEYAARRSPVRAALPEGAPTDASATGRAREVLSDAIRDYGLVGGADRVAERVDSLRDAGADEIVAYPARGLDPLLG